MPACDGVFRTRSYFSSWKRVRPALGVCLPRANARYLGKHVAGGAELPAAMCFTRLQKLSRYLQWVCWIFLPLGISQPVSSIKKETSH